MLEDILLQIKKPARYLGNEWNVIRKDFDKQGIKFAICFPDLYEIGMSYIGLHIIYGLLNSQEGVVCERVFLPDLDMQHILRSRRIPIFSLESKRPLREFDFLGFSLNYELDYTNFLAMLDLAGIPLEAKDRPLGFPLVIAGGFCMVNPEPLADFVDLFFVGEAEEALPEMLSAYKKLKNTNCDPGPDKEGILAELAKIEGIYVPSFYEVEYSFPQGLGARLRPKYPWVPAKIKKRIVKDLDNAYYPVAWLVPYCSIIHDRGCIEMMRGCPHGCNFCQAKNFYSYLRMRSPEKILELADKIYRNTGYEEISLVGLSVSDYPNLTEIVSILSDRFREQAVSLSLPSLRPKSYLGGLAEYLAKVHKTTLTFAPEAGSQRLRQLINKNFDLEEFYSVVLSIYKAGWQGVKLYFMIGLPQEELNDLDDILQIAKEVSQLRLKVASYPARVTLGISFFVPKPHTLFERESMASIELLREKKIYLIKKSKRLSRYITLSFNNLESSFLEAIFCRGDRSLGRVLLTAYKNGCLLDGWSERLKFGSWLEAFRICGKDTSLFLNAESFQQALPWQHIDLTYKTKCGSE